MKNRVESDRTIRPYIELFAISYYALDKAKNEKCESFYNCLIAMLFCAFSIEAFINHLGEKFVSNWDEKERKLDYKEKINLIVETKNIKIDKSEEPFCFINAIFDYRKDIVHARTEHLIKDEFIESDRPTVMPLAKWEKMTTLDLAKKFHSHTKEIIESLNELINNDEKPFKTPWSYSWSRKL